MVVYFASDELLRSAAAVQDRLGVTATRKTPAIKKWLAAHPRFHLHFIPTSGSWLNLVEHWFAGLNQPQTPPLVPRSVKALEDDVNAWIAVWNDEPKPVVWTKTADEILAGLDRYCSRTTQDTSDGRVLRCVAGRQ